MIPPSQYTFEYIFTDISIAKNNVLAILPENSTFPGSEAPGPPEGALSQGETFALNFLLDETVSLDLTDERSHLPFDLMRVNDTEALRWESEV